MNTGATADRLRQALIGPQVELSAALRMLDEAGSGALVVVDADRRLLGLLTDGDIRRALLGGVSLVTSSIDVATPDPVIVAPTCAPRDALQLMSRRQIDQVPVVDAAGRVVDLLLRKDLVEPQHGLARSRARVADVAVEPARSIAEAMQRMDRAGTGALAVCNEAGQLLALMTDGDVRRAVMRGVSLEEPCVSIASPDPVVSAVRPSDDAALELMVERDVNHLPIVDAAGRLVDLLVRRDFVGDDEALAMSAVVMAGGFGTRLAPLTDNVPKPMLPVGDRPVLERTLERLRGAGIRRVHITTHYLPACIEEHFGDGERFGLELTYSREVVPLGTAGGLRMMERPSAPLLVLNGDIVTSTPYAEMLSFHRVHRADLTVAVRKYQVDVPYGVVDCDDVAVAGLTEKPSFDFFVNAGVYLLEPHAFDLVPEDRHYDMTELIDALLHRGDVVVSFPIHEYWLDMGRLEDYDRVQSDFALGKF